MERLLPLLCLLLCPLPLAAEIYKIIDEEGNVHYSDRPAPGAEKVILPPPSVYTPPRLPMGRPSERDEASPDAIYESLRILSPGNDEAVRSNNGDLVVKLAVTPELKRRRGHRLLLLLDGKEVPVKGGVYQFRNLDRGTHTLGARVVDRQGATLIEAEPVTFHLLRNSIITNPPSMRYPGLPQPQSGP